MGDGREASVIALGGEGRRSFNHFCCLSITEVIPED